MHTFSSKLWTYTLLLLCGGSGLASEPRTFEKDVRPILKAHCFHCHGESGVSEGSLDVRLRRWLVRGGDSGEAIVPGEPTDSLLLERVVQGDMPPEDKRLSEADISILREWIQQGATTAREEPESLDNGDYFTEEERSFWSFQPIARPPVPSIAAASIRNPIDAFIINRLRQHELELSPEADRRTLIRRLTYDLWGLPPDPQMVESFLADSDPAAYERLVDRLLASPRYGERWGRHWLDVAGYADSDGYTEADTEREFAYLYRDYVIDSFNHNLPFDRFIQEQLAGDEMGPSVAAAEELSPSRISQLAATGFLRMAPDGTASAAVDRDVAINESIADTLDIVGTSLLGLTVGCARCHDHRYDPISHADYHRFRAIFEPALDWKAWQPPKQRRRSLYTPAEREQKADIDRRLAVAEETLRKRKQEHLDRILHEELLVVPEDKRLLIKAAFEAKAAHRSPLQIALLEEYPSIASISPGSLYLYSNKRGRRADDIERVAAELETQFIERTQLERTASLPPDQQREFLSWLSATTATQNAQDRPRREAFAELVVTADSLKQFAPDRFGELKRYRDAAARCRELDANADLAKLDAEIKSIRALAPPEQFVRLLTEPPDHTPTTYLFLRGDHQQAGQACEPSELTVLKSASPTTIPHNDPQLPTTGRRLAYAKHLTNGQHPLVARVLINRVWLQHFGRGLVDSPGDFGYLGSEPTHPALLDWLATEWMQQGWDLKYMHRLILGSATYRQQSQRSEKRDRVDPENAWYARMSVRRLESEVLRDAILTVSHSMLHELHGPPVPVKEDAVGQIVLGREMLDGERKPTGDDSDFPGVSRRSVYIQVRRSRPLAVLETFDLPTVTPNCTQRSFSNVATQALMLMNSKFTTQQADLFAADLVRSNSEVAQQIAAAWQRCYTQDITPSVLDSLLAFVATQSDLFLARDNKLTAEVAHHKALASVCHALLSSNEFLYVD
ncbi:Planctomycete cytochrome C [Aureliella helgolandensis]|uniref:Planctomycete cytochrome C n=2 Tax=Aureliella helgolandensis TaxID=2527968 RepID=A0A518G933_9BACT|nr:Planctomycete cytochrome C [Aureliella helgolandensis]